MPNFDDTALLRGNEKPGVDPILLKVLDAVPFRLSTDDGIDAVRQRLRDLPRRAVHPELRVEDRAIDGPGGPIDIRIYWPPTQNTAPVVVFFHGGGVGVFGCQAVIDGNHDRVGADTSRIAVAGDSAGGTIAAAVAQRARDEGGPALAFQLLWYPSTMWDTSLPSFTENANALILDSKAIADFSRWYAGEVDMSNPPPGMAPGRADNLAGLPSAYIAVAGFDPLRDDGIKYGELLAGAGVPAEVHNAETMVHGYVGYAGVVPAATTAMDRGLAALRVALHG